MPQLDLSDTNGAQTKSDAAYKTISEVSDELGVPQHVLRFWETNFPQIKPSRMRGARRYYRPEDIELLKKIKTLLYEQGYTIKGAKKLIKSKGFPADLLSPTSPVPKKKDGPADVQSLVSELRILKSMLTTLL